MEHRNEKNIKCPYCDWENSDSYEFTEDSGNYICEDCGKEFFVERNIQITYDTSRINCEEKGLTHKYEFDSKYSKTSNFENRKWNDIPEEKWQYFRIMKCTVCGDYEFQHLTKEEYQKI